VRNEAQAAFPRAATRAAGSATATIPAVASPSQSPTEAPAWPRFPGGRTWRNSLLRSSRPDGSVA